MAEWKDLQIYCEFVCTTTDKINLKPYFLDARQHSNSGYQNKNKKTID